MFFSSLLEALGVTTSIALSCAPLNPPSAHRQFCKNETARNSKQPNVVDCCLQHVDKILQTIQFVCRGGMKRDPSASSTRLSVLGVALVNSSTLLKSMFLHASQMNSDVVAGRSIV